jgi:PAS domain-containing protein
MDAAAAAAASSSAASSVKEDEPKATARVQINHAWERLTGYSQTEMVERLRREHATCALMRFLFRSDFASAIHKISLVAAMERLSHGQHYVVVRTKSGEELYCLTSFHVLFTSTGVFQGMVHTLMPLPSSTPVPPFVPGVDQTEAALVYGNFTPKHRQIDWKAKLLMQQ